MAIKITGVELTKENLDRISKDALDAAYQAITDCIRHLGGASVELAPILTGDLRSSMSSDVKKVDNGIIGTVSFSTPYAIRMHESYYNLGPVSSKAPGFDGEPVGRKYLERPLFKYKDKYLEKIQQAIRERLK